MTYTSINAIQLCTKRRCIQVLQKFRLGAGVTKIILLIKPGGRNYLENEISY